MENKLSNNFYDACYAYIKAFAKKQGLKFHDWADFENCVVDFGGTDFYNMDEIRYDIDNNIKAGLIVEWQEACLEAYSKDNNARMINYKSYTEGLRYGN